VAGPLDGIKIVDVSAILSGPLATMLLADQGAEVVKIEPVLHGDIMRLGPFQRGGLATFFANANRGKRSMAMNVTTDRGREIVLDLVRQADVFVQNWRPGAAARLQLSEPELRAINPDLIYVSISGYGPTGPYHDRRVYDPIIQGLTGHVAIQINPQAPIQDLVRNVVADKASAYTAAQAITAALFARERGAGGQHIEVPMIDASLAFFWPDGMMAQTLVGEGEIAMPGPTLYELYQLTQTVDGHLIYFAASDVEFLGLYRALGHPEWCDDERFNSIPGRAVTENREALGELLYGEFQRWKTSEILERMVEEQVPVGPVLTLEEIFEDPQILHNQCVFEREHPTAGRIRQAKPAARFDKTPQAPGRLPPLHGEHTDEVLSELGLDVAAVAELRKDGVIA
jgi:crotonobetainyl-CoA:carnitine CoA-transferase CaiB-like acyl-CoA transferase